MLDIRFIRENRELVEKSAKEKGFDVDVQKLIELDEQRKNVIQSIESEQATRNVHAKNRDQDQGSASSEKIQKGKDIKNKISELQTKLEPINNDFHKLLREVPNVFPDDTPLGGEEDNREERKWGNTDDKDYKIFDHVTWGENHGMLDFERGAKVAGSKFYFTMDALVELELAILQQGFKMAAKLGFVPTFVPHLVNSRIIDGAGFTARSADEKQIYEVKDEDLNLIATAEIPLTGYHADEILEEKDLPKLYAGYSPAYRVEAGAYGKHSKGLYRVHQFNKLELYVFCKPEASEQWHTKMVELEERLCQTLEIPYRVVRIAAGDLGAPAYKKYDVEYWSPIDKAYRELMSCSNVTDYQARRLNIRYKDPQKGTTFVHTLNGTAAAMSRMPIAIIENFQQADGSVVVPEVLQEYMGGKQSI